MSCLYLIFDYVSTHEKETFASAVFLQLLLFSCLAIEVATEFGCLDGYYFQLNQIIHLSAAIICARHSTTTHDEVRGENY